MSTIRQPRNRYWGLSRQKLIKLCEENNINTKGSKRDLIQRLINQSAIPKNHIIDKQTTRKKCDNTKQNKHHRYVFYNRVKCQESVDKFCINTLGLQDWNVAVSSLIFDYFKSKIDEFLCDEHKVVYTQRSWHTYSVRIRQYIFYAKQATAMQ